MMCEICHANDAVLHVQQIVNDERKELHMCRECAEKKGFFQDLVTLDFSLDAIANVKPEKVQKERRKEHTKKNEAFRLRCSVCGFQFSDVNEEFRLGCSECYVEFKELLMPIIHGAQAGIQHTGKTPNHDSKTIKRERTRKGLTKRLTQMLKREDYEGAARIRDRIRQLEEGVEATEERASET